jgi:hypothetical protein
MELPSCPHCGSGDTASVQVGIIGRTIYIAGSTRKFKLVPNMKDKKGKYFCNDCKKYFGDEEEGGGEISGFTLRLKNGGEAEEIAGAIKNIQAAWAKRNPERAHRLYPTVWDENGDPIQPPVKNAKRISKSASTGSTSSNMKITLSACDPHARRIFETLVNGWKEAGGTVMCIRPGRIYLKLNTKAHASGRSARLPRNFNLVVLAAPLGKRSAHIQVTWGLGRIKDLPPTQNTAYLDCIPKVVAQFEKMVAALPGFEQEGTITRLVTDRQFKPTHTRLLMDGLVAVRDAEASAL